MSGSVPSAFLPGTIVADKYRIERVIASGGQGTVVQATHLHLQESVAIKFPHLSDEAAEETVERLLREARAVFRLRGENIARVIDVDVDTREGAPFIVMEYLQGVDLKEFMAEKGPLACEMAVGLALQACEGIAEAHDRGIVHRDLKPSNLFVTERTDGTPLLKVLDFGVSKSTAFRVPEDDMADLTNPLRMLGTPRYMSPEQACDASSVDPRTDIWALGVILQEMLTGTPVFRARNGTEVLAHIMGKNPIPVSLLRPDVPLEIERVLLRCLQKDPEHRFATVQSLAEGLAPFAPAWAAGNVERLQRHSRRLGSQLPQPLPGATGGGRGRATKKTAALVLSAAMAAAIGGLWAITRATGKMAPFMSSAERETSDTVPVHERRLPPLVEALTAGVPPPDGRTTEAGGRALEGGSLPGAEVAGGAGGDRRARVTSLARASRGEGSSTPALVTSRASSLATKRSRTKAGTKAGTKAHHTAGARQAAAQRLLKAAPLDSGSEARRPAVLTAEPAAEPENPLEGRK